MTQYLPPPSSTTDKGDDAAKERIRMEQRFNSMSPKTIEKLFSQPVYRSGLIKYTVRRPEHKLRDLARIVLGQSEEFLGELDIVQVGKLFYNRGMTFTLEQIVNTTLRRVQELAVSEIFSNYNDGVDRNLSTLFLVHDKAGNISVVTMKNEGDYFPCTFAPLTEGPLFEGPVMTIMFRHPNPHLVWRIRAVETEEVSVSTAPQLEEMRDIKWSLGGFLEPSGPRREEQILREQIEAAYAMQNLDTRLGYAVYLGADGHAESLDERTLFGFPKNGPAFDPNDLAMDAWMEDLRMMMNMQCGFEAVPPRQGIARTKQRNIKLGWLRDCGLTFSIRECGLFMRNAPRLRDEDAYVILVHDNEETVFKVKITYRENRIALINIAHAHLYERLNKWSSHVKFCIRTPLMDSRIVISNPRLTEYKSNSCLLPGISSVSCVG